ncbi:MAG: phosphatase PAP2 family protein [Anaerolineae bacterium]|jgi:membrane-associated phospholipid phosphatase
MTDVLYFYVSLFCVQHSLFHELPAPVNHVLEFLAGWYAAPLGLLLIVFVYWFVGVTATDRLANQRAVLRGLMSALIAWILTVLVQLLWLLVLRGPQWKETVAGWACWEGVPSACPAAAIGFALGATLWRRNWHWGMGCVLATGLWAVAQVFVGVHYPLDVVVGAAIGIGLAWWLRSMAWLDRPLDVLIRLARRFMLA